MKIVAISGSLRSNSFNTSLLRSAQLYVPVGCEMQIAPINKIPLYNYDEEVAQGLPNAVVMLKNQIVESDAILISTPEYNHGIPGVLKNALDWLTRPTEDVPYVFGNRKIGLIGASPSRLGTAFSQTAWLPILRYLNTHTYFGNQLFVSSAHSVFDKDGKLIDKKTQEMLKTYMRGFCEFIEKNN